jgi:hypothetical protein
MRLRYTALATQAPLADDHRPSPLGGPSAVQFSFTLAGSMVPWHSGVDGLVGGPSLMGSVDTLLRHEPT